MKNLTLILLMVLISFKTSSAQTDNINLSDYKNIIARYFSNTFNKNSLYSKEILIQKDSIFFNTIESINAQTKVIDKVNNLKRIKNNQTVIELVTDSSYSEDNFSVKEVKYEVQRKVNKDIFVLGGYATFKIVYNAKSITITEIANTGLGSPKPLMISGLNSIDDYKIEELALNYLLEEISIKDSSLIKFKLITDGKTSGYLTSYREVCGYWKDNLRNDSLVKHEVLKEENRTSNYILLPIFELNFPEKYKKPTKIKKKERNQFIEVTSVSHKIKIQESYHVTINSKYLNLGQGIRFNIKMDKNGNVIDYCLKYWIN